MTSSPKRLWAGTTLDERRAFRRAALLEAALDIIGEEGSAGVTVRSLCRRTGFTDRYFYESFASRDQLLAELYRAVTDETFEKLREAAADVVNDKRAWARSIVGVFVGLSETDPRKARLLVVEPLSEPTLTGATVSAVPILTEAMKPGLAAGTSKRKRAMTAIGITGAIGSLFAAWLSGNLKVTREELEAHCIELLVNTTKLGNP
jgi:AcrR family transcriptional regulator